MAKNFVLEQAQPVIDTLISSLRNALLLIEKYINSFDTKSFFEFSHTENKRILLKKEYSDFQTAISAPLKDIEEAYAKLSSLLIRADIEMELDTILLLQDLFEKYLHFEKKLSEYGASVKLIFDDNSVSASKLLEEAKSFRFSTLSLLKLLE